MYEQIQKAVCLLNQEYICGFHVGEESRTCDLQEICRFLEEKCRQDGTVCTWKRETQKPEPTISGSVPPVSGTSDDLRLAYSQFPGAK